MTEVMMSNMSPPRLSGGFARSCALVLASLASLAGCSSSDDKVLGTQPAAGSAGTASGGQGGAGSQSGTGAQAGQGGSSQAGHHTGGAGSHAGNHGAGSQGGMGAQSGQGGSQAGNPSGGGSGAAGDPGPPVPTYVPSPSLAGGPDLIGPFDVNLGLQPSWGTGGIPGPYAPNEGAFRFTCGGEGQLLFDDPLVYPGQPNKSHLHKFSGPKSANAFTTSESLRMLGESNCNYGEHTLNHSLYWMPAVEDDQGNVVNPEWEAFYYKRLRASAPECHPENHEKAVGICIPLPNSIRFVYGWNPNKPDAPAEGMSWYCDQGTGAHFSNLDEVFNSGCGVGATLVADLVAPSCWDGKYLDTPDHREHTARPSYGDWGYGKCPDTHPYLIPTMETKKAFKVTEDMFGTNADGTKYSRLRCSSDHAKSGAKPCETMHADYMEAWDARAKKMWTDHAIDLGLNCSGGDLGNGLQLIGASQPAYGWTNPNPRTPIPQ